jgi:hypothetical protein
VGGGRARTPAPERGLPSRARAWLVRYKRAEESTAELARSVRLLIVQPSDDDPVPFGVVLDLDEAFRILEALEDARLALREARAGLGLQDELATVIRMLHGRLGFDEGGVR